MLEELRDRGIDAYQPYWALYADLAAKTGRVAEASVAYDRATGLASDPALRAFLTSRKSQLTAQETR